MGDLLGSLVWGAKSGQYCVIEGGSLHITLTTVIFLLLIKKKKFIFQTISISKVKSGGDPLTSVRRQGKKKN
jgi:hypothetical protein